MLGMTCSEVDDAIIGHFSKGIIRFFHSLPFLKFATNEAIQRTEAYEYAQSLGVHTCSLPNFQVSRGCVGWPVLTSACLVRFLNSQRSNDEAFCFVGVFFCFLIPCIYH